MAIYKSILDLVGGTPLVELTQFEKENDLKATVLARSEEHTSELQSQR